VEDVRGRAGKGIGAIRLFSALATGWFLCTAAPARADRLVIKGGEVIFGRVTDEKDSVIRYYDRFDRPKKLAASKVDTLIYDSREVQGLVKVAFRKGRTSDRTGLFRIRHSEELDLEVEYKTDSVGELDLFFRNQVHLRVLPNSRFKVSKAPKDADDPLLFELKSGRILATSPQREALLRVVTPGGIAVGRGEFQAGVVSSPSDSSMQIMCLRGLTGAQESPQSPGELVVEEGKSVGLIRREGVFDRRAPDGREEEFFRSLAANMGHYRFSRIEYPGIGYLPKAITGLGFMVFFYGTAIGILDYVNHI
jgi:hypothetical protein